MMKIEIRPARMDDHSAIESIMKQVQQLHVELRPDIYRSVDTVLPEEALREEIGNGCFFVAEADEKVVGVLEIVYRCVRSPHQLPRDVVFVETMAVDEAYRGRGIGRAFFDFLRQLKADKGLDGIELQVNVRNVQAMAMYEKVGFTPKSVNMELLE